MEATEKESLFHREERVSGVQTRERTRMMTTEERSWKSCNIRLQTCSLGAGGSPAYARVEPVNQRQKDHIS